MSRASDIRTYIVAKQPNMTIDELYVLVAQLHGSIEALTSLRQNNEKPPVPVTIKNVTFELRGNKIHTKEGIAFSPSSLQTFTETLFLMKGAMGLGSRTFATIDPDLYGDLLLACGNVQEDVAKINSEIFSGLLKRYHNRTRVGANNDYQFKYRLSTCKNRFITFDLKNMVFDDKDHVDFDIQVNDPILQEVLGGRHRYPMPTGKVASQRISEKLQSAFVEITQEQDTMNTLVNGLKKYGMEQSEIDVLLGIFAGWVKDNKLTGAVTCTDKNFDIFSVTFGRVPARLDEVSIAIMDVNRTILLGTKFSGSAICAELFKKREDVVQTWTKVSDSFAVAALILDKQETEIYHSLVEKELDPVSVNFDNKVTLAKSRLILISPKVHTAGEDVLYRPYSFTSTGMLTTLGLVSYSEVMEYRRITKTLEQSILDNEREVDWGNVITPKVGFWAKVKRWFKAA